MNAWEAELAELRREYLAEASERLARGRAALARLRAGERAAAADLRRVFHGFAGSGSTYGFALVSELGLAGEALADEWPDGSEVEPRLAQAGDLLARLEAELSLPPIEARSTAPLESSDPVPSERASETNPAQEIVVVEDDKAMLEALGAALRREGYRVRPARSLAEAQAALRAALPDAVVADVILPDGEVFGLVERLRERAGGADLPVVLQSVRAALVDRVEAIRCGADAFFPKPVDLDAVVRRLQLLLLRHAHEPARILSVEDDAMQAAYLRGVLEPAGYTFRCCPEPAGLEAALCEFQPDLVLMDALLPGATGYDLAHALRQDERHGLLPVVILTTQGQQGNRLASTRAGATDHLLKPVSPATLLTTVAARLEQARLLRSLLERDGLTGLLTHSALFERAAAVASEARRSGEPAAWIMLDLDHFKRVNDRHGHAAGDRVLRALGALLRRRLRQSDILGRYGGEEFAMILRGIEVDDAGRLADRLREEFAALRHDAPGGGPQFTVTLSAGVAAYRPGLEVKDWCRLADASLYAAKAAGRDRVATDQAGGRSARLRTRSGPAVIVPAACPVPRACAS